MKIFAFHILVLLQSSLFTQSKEEFVNQVSGLVVDSSFTKFYLSEFARPCRFRRFDYGQLNQYGLKETVPLEILNELSRRVYEDKADLYWVSGKLSRAICLDDEQAQNILNPTRIFRYDARLSETERKKAIKKTRKQWDKKPLEDKLVYYFSRPEFTDDHQYAVINLDFRCDDHECGQFLTYIFRKEQDHWKTVGIISASEAGSGG
jgi:hypothetical protein